MATGEKKRVCFVVMPFGEKQDADGQLIDFDDIYRFFFRKAIESLNLECIRCDEIAEAGSIHEKMFEHLHKSDVVVVDITALNANVFYELGIRHTLAKSVTVLIRRKGTVVPFNIQSLQVVEYDQTKFASIERAKDRILEIIKNGLNSKKNDSPVHAALCLNIGAEPRPIGESKKYRYPLINSKKSISLVTGELHSVKDIDVWVNSENTNMLMARPLDNSISGIIRCLGAKKDDGKMEDTIANELNRIMAERGQTSVSPGEILVTTAGSLKKTHNVKKIFHAASVIGQFGKGYFPIPDVPECVHNALKKADEEFQTAEVSSILFPLMGTGVSNRDFEERVEALLEAAIGYLNGNTAAVIEDVYFLNYSDRELEVCQRLLQANPLVSAAPEPPPFSAADSKPMPPPLSKPGKPEPEPAHAAPLETKAEEKKKPDKDPAHP